MWISHSIAEIRSILETGVMHEHLTWNLLTPFQELYQPLPMVGLLGVERPLETPIMNKQGKVGRRTGCYKGDDVFVSESPEPEVTRMGSKSPEL